MRKPPKGKAIAMVSVGTKGQIVIPKNMRDMFGIEPGETLIIAADKKRGIAIITDSNAIDRLSSIALNCGNGEEEEK